MLRNQSKVFTKPFERVLYCYNAMQPIYRDLMRDVPKLELYEGLPDITEVTSVPDSCVVFDDLMHKAVNSDQSVTLFTQYRHLKLSMVSMHACSTSDAP